MGGGGGVTCVVFSLFPDVSALHVIRQEVEVFHVNLRSCPDEASPC